MTPLTVFSVSSHPSSPSPLPGEEQVSWRVSQRLLQVAAQQALQLLSQPVSKGRLGTRQRLEGLLRLLHLHGEKQEFAVEQL
jgi:hypothetical protein